MNKQYQEYYTDCKPILNYMVNKLELKDGDTVLEPCGGDGAFVDQLLNTDKNISISIFELNPTSVCKLNHKYASISTINIRHTDTLLTPELLTKKLKFSKIIGNPPYGAQQSKEIKQRLTSAYKNIYTKESYTLFLYICIQALNNHGRLTFIIPDTFLSLNRHKAVRQFILKNTSIDEILLFPSSFFPGINFGYANLCIITLERNFNIDENIKNSFIIRKGFKNVKQIGDINIPYSKFTQNEIYNNINSSFLISDEPEIRRLINDVSLKKIGDIADCVTGFYSGNDKKYMHPANSSLKNAKKYEVVKKEQIFNGILSIEEKKYGIKSTCCLLPIVKGGNKNFYKPNEWFIDWSEKAILEYRKNKKCRFQNEKFYFTEGIAVPMVRSSRISAALIGKRLFDQSIVGIFPKNDNLTFYLLGFFNSNICSKLISAINPSTNNSANYIKLIPWIEPEDKNITDIGEITRFIVNTIEKRPSINVFEDLHEYISIIDDYFTKLYLKRTK